MNTDICPICGLDGVEETPPQANQNAPVITCERCGRYMMAGLMVKNWRRRRAEGERLSMEDEKLLPYLSAYTRQTCESGGKAQLDSKNWRGYARQHSNTPEKQKLHKLLFLIKERTPIPGHSFPFDCDLSYPLVDVASTMECCQLVKYLKMQDLLEFIPKSRSSCEVTITFAGRQFLEDRSRQVDEITDVEVAPEVAPYEYISQSRLDELRDLRPTNFDLQRLIRLCKEIDVSFRNECWFAVAALARALIDHVPPIFNQKTFSEVANNYGGTKSFKGSM